MKIKPDLFIPDSSNQACSDRQAVLQIFYPTETSTDCAQDLELNVRLRDDILEVIINVSDERLKCLHLRS